MAFIVNGSTIISFAEYQDVLDSDQRLFEANEGLTDEVVENSLIRATDRILVLLRNTDWWRTMWLSQSTNLQIQSVADIPALDISKIQDRQKDFTDLCVYYGMYNYILPKIADFSKEDNAERAKIGFYQAKFDLLFQELVNSGDWYNFDGSGIISSAEKQPGYYREMRIR